MTIALWCVLLAGLMPFVAIGFAKWGGFDNRNPRDWEARLTGRRSRAHAAHLNSFEAFPLFAAGVIIATIAKAPHGIIDTIAILFIVARSGYIWCYLADRAASEACFGLPASD